MGGTECLEGLEGGAFGDNEGIACLIYHPEWLIFTTSPMRTSRRQQGPFGLRAPRVCSARAASTTQ